jgi:hypothetical protein
MEVVCHQTPGIDLQTLVFLAIFQGVYYDTLIDYFGLMSATYFGVTSATCFGAKGATHFGAKGATISEQRVPLFELP